ncbi:succinoglycan biosynthesis protein ExoA [Novosphingobium sp. PhB165]|uniref:glycosyltransferase family 2 protein n=1 Tax=Novosphingobium sp. PhB165 TaxID=2485105 RepID=UPI00104AC90E|nr:glycosyltransferase family 2 protein [Novosphingobium sp. PhB165]TCM18001.1 succinoglycan biosynthesis protein ExoA [Novosphingobium sp. PhB165]
MNGVLIVVPCLNEERHLPGLLDWLIRENGDATIVVADGGSTDASRSIVSRRAAHHANLILLDNPARLQSAGINLAVRRHSAGHHWLVRVDAHCDYPSGYVGGLVEAARRHRAASVVVPMVTYGRGCFQKSAAAAQNSRLGNGGSAHRRIVSGRFVDHGHHALFDLALFRQVGGYDESFSHNEDAEFDLRLAAAGGRIWLEPALPLGYWPRDRPGALFRQYRGYGRGRAMTLARHAAPIKLRQAIPVAIAPLVLMALVGFCLAPIVPRASLLALPALGWATLCLGYGLVLGVRNRSRCMAGAGMAAMVMHLAWSLGFIGQKLIGPRPGLPPRAIEALA